MAQKNILDLKPFDLKHNEILSDSISIAPICNGDIADICQMYQNRWFRESSERMIPVFHELLAALGNDVYLADVICKMSGESSISKMIAESSVESELEQMVLEGIATVQMGELSGQKVYQLTDEFTEEYMKKFITPPFVERNWWQRLCDRVTARMIGKTIRSSDKDEHQDTIDYLRGRLTPEKIARRRIDKRAQDKANEMISKYRIEDGTQIDLERLIQDWKRFQISRGMRDASVFRILVGGLGYAVVEVADVEFSEISGSTKRIRDVQSLSRVWQSQLNQVAGRVLEGFCIEFGKIYEKDVERVKELTKAKRNIGHVINITISLKHKFANITEQADKSYDSPDWQKLFKEIEQRRLAKQIEAMKLASRKREKKVPDEDPYDLWSNVPDIAKVYGANRDVPEKRPGKMTMRYHRKIADIRDHERGRQIYNFYRICRASSVWKMMEPETIEKGEQLSANAINACKDSLLWVSKFVDEEQFRELWAKFRDASRDDEETARYITETFCEMLKKSEKLPLEIRFKRAVPRRLRNAWDRCDWLWKNVRGKSRTLVKSVIGEVNYACFTIKEVWCRRITAGGILNYLRFQILEWYFMSPTAFRLRKQRMFRKALEGIQKSPELCEISRDIKCKVIEGIRPVIEDALEEVYKVGSERFKEINENTRQNRRNNVKEHGLFGWLRTETMFTRSYRLFDSKKWSYVVRSVMNEVDRSRICRSVYDMNDVIDPEVCHVVGMVSKVDSISNYHGIYPIFLEELMSWLCKAENPIVFRTNGISETMSKEYKRSTEVYYDKWHDKELMLFRSDSIQYSNGQFDIVYIDTKLIGAQ